MFLQSVGGAADAAGNAAKGAFEQATKSAKGLERATQLADVAVMDLAGSMAKIAFPAAVIQDVDKLRELTYDMTRQGLGQTKLVGDAISETMAEATFETLQFGIGLDDNLNLMKSINDVMKTNTLLSTEQVVNMQALANNAGVTASEITPIIEGFRTIGVGTDKAIENIGDMQQQARDYGINVGEFMKGISSNLKMMSSYNFKDGVEGFSRMVMKAQALRIDVGKTFSMAEGLLEPEKAIETAASFQMLGGAIGDLGDPFKLLHMAQTDAEGLQDAVIGMAESAVVFNEETGEFDIPVTEMYRLREAAGAAGMSYQEMTELAFKAAERTKKLDLLGTTTIPQDYKDLVANMGNIKGGQLEVTIPSFDEAGKKIGTVTKKAHELNQADYDTLKEMQEQSNMDEKEIALQSMGFLETIANTTASGNFAPVMLGVNTGGVIDAQEAFKGVADAALEGLNDAFNRKEVEDYGAALTEHIAKGMQDEQATQHFQDTAGKIMANLVDIPQTMFDDANEKLDADNLLKDIKLDELLAEKLQGLSGVFDGISSDILSMFPPNVRDEIQANAQAIHGGLVLVGDSLEYILGENLSLFMSGSQSARQSTDRDTEDDFILRPGMDPISFNKDDLILGGTKLFDAVNSINGMGGNMMVDGSQSMNGQVKLDVGGRIDLSVDGRNLPQNISSEQLAMEIVNNPDFTSKLMSIFTDSNNTYSV
jgi:hypothetical protein